MSEQVKAVSSVSCVHLNHLSHTLDYCVLLYVLKQLQVTQISCLPLTNVSLIPHLQCRVGRISHYFSFFFLAKIYMNHILQLESFYPWQEADKEHTLKKGALCLAGLILHVSECGFNHLQSEIQWSLWVCNHIYGDINKFYASVYA